MLHTGHVLMKRTVFGVEIGGGDAGSFQFVERSTQEWSGRLTASPFRPQAKVICTAMPAAHGNRPRISLAWAMRPMPRASAASRM